jgi:hypothetical protein
VSNGEVVCTEFGLLRGNKATGGQVKGWSQLSSSVRFGIERRHPNGPLEGPEVERRGEAEVVRAARYVRQRRELEEEEE